jgi:hypothetical protein
METASRLAFERVRLELLQHQQCLRDDDTTAGRRRHDFDAQAAVPEAKRFAKHGAVRAQIVEGQKSAASRHCVDERLGDGPVVETRVSELGDTPQRRRQIGPAQPGARSARAEPGTLTKRAPRRDVLPECGPAPAERERLPRANPVTLLGELDGRQHHRRAWQRAEAAVRKIQSGNAARDADGRRAGTPLSDHAIESLLREAERRCLAEIDRNARLARELDQHETAAADISRARVSHGQRVRHGDCSIDSVAALLEDLNAGLGRLSLHRRDDAVRAAHGARPAAPNYDRRIARLSGLDGRNIVRSSG